MDDETDLHRLADALNANGRDLEAADLGLLGIDAIGAESLADLLGGVGGASIGVLELELLRGDVELDERCIGSGLEFAIGSDVNGVALGRLLARVLRECGDGR